MICLIFTHFSAIFAQITIFWNAHRCQQYPNTVNKSLYHVYSVVPLFSSFLQYYTVPLLLSDSSHSDGIQWNPVEYSGVQQIGNAHRPCKQYPNIVDNSLHHVYSFFLIFLHFLLIFLLITILGNAHTACKQCTNIVNNGLHLSLYFFLIFSDFFLRIFN